jgi:hypothetical protein
MTLCVEFRVESVPKVRRCQSRNDEFFKKNFPSRLLVARRQWYCGECKYRIQTNNNHLLGLITCDDPQLVLVVTSSRQQRLFRRTASINDTRRFSFTIARKRSALCALSPRSTLTNTSCSYVSLNHCYTVPLSIVVATVLSTNATQQFRYYGSRECPTTIMSLGDVMQW